MSYENIKLICETLLAVATLVASTYLTMHVNNTHKKIHEVNNKNDKSVINIVKSDNNKNDNKVKE